MGGLDGKSGKPESEGKVPERKDGDIPHTRVLRSKKHGPKDQALKLSKGLHQSNDGSLEHAAARGVRGLDAAETNTLQEENRCTGEPGSDLSSDYEAPPSSNEERSAGGILAEAEGEMEDAGMSPASAQSTEPAEADAARPDAAALRTSSRSPSSSDHQTLSPAGSIPSSNPSRSPSLESEGMPVDGRRASNSSQSDDDQPRSLSPDTEQDHEHEQQESIQTSDEDPEEASSMREDAPSVSEAAGIAPRKAERHGARTSFNLARGRTKLLLMGLFTTVMILVGLALVGRLPSVEQLDGQWLSHRVQPYAGSLYASALTLVGMVQSYLFADPTGPRRSARRAIGSRLDETYTSLSQAVAATSQLYTIPFVIGEKRRQAMGFHLPEGSLLMESLQLFLNQTLDLDEEILALMLSGARLGNLALREQEMTEAAIHSVSSGWYWRKFASIQLSKPSAQEARLKARLQQHISRLLDEVASTEKVASHVLRRFSLVADTGEQIRDTAVQDKTRLLHRKGAVASQHLWVFRVGLNVLQWNEPEDLAEISANLETAHDIHQWAVEVLPWLQKVLLHTKNAKVQIGSLSAMLTQGLTITWSSEDQRHELVEFLNSFAEGVLMLSENVKAWKELKGSSYI